VLDTALGQRRTRRQPGRTTAHNDAIDGHFKHPLPG
jgi:hypothetical protein